MSTVKRMDRKLASIQAGAYRPADFIIADAKDSDMALGTGVAGPELDSAGRPTGRMRPLAIYRAGMERMVESDAIDIMLTSLSSGEYLSRKGVFVRSEVTPAIRLNDGSDIWHWRGANYRHLPTVPFRTARLDRVRPIADLGLYALTFFKRPRPGPALARCLCVLPRRGLGTGRAALPRSVQPAVPRRGTGRRLRHLQQRRHRALPRGRVEARPPGLPQGRLQRPARHRGACLLRSRQPHRRHPRGRLLDDARHIGDGQAGGALRRAGRALRAKDLLRRGPGRHRSGPCAASSRRACRRRRPQGPITTSSARTACAPRCRSRRISSSPIRC